MFLTEVLVEEIHYFEDRIQTVIVMYVVAYRSLYLAEILLQWTISDSSCSTHLKGFLLWELKNILHYCSHNS